MLDVNHSIRMQIVIVWMYMGVDSFLQGGDRP